MYERPRFATTYLIWLFLLVAALLVALSGLYVWLEWSVLQATYAEKAGLDWFATVFYHDYTFIVAGLLALLTLNPRPGRSDLSSAVTALRTLQRMLMGVEAAPVVSLGPRRALWTFWQLVKWAIAFTVIAWFNGLPALGNVTIVAYALTKGLGSWAEVPRVFVLPLLPASESELVRLMPTMEVQYRLVYVILTAALAVIAVRAGLKMLPDLVTQRRNASIRDLFAILASVVGATMLWAPYWSMDVTTPYDFVISITLLAAFASVAVYYHLKRSESGGSFRERRRTLAIALGVALLLVIGGNIVVIAAYRLNWNNNWLQYEWKPLTEKMIAVTRWAAGTQAVSDRPMSQVPAGNVTKTLSLVRQWDQAAARTKMRNQIGVNWMTLSDSDIVYVGGREYWVGPTTIAYPSEDWISRRLIYTHTSKVIVVDSHTGLFIAPQEAFKIPSEPSIYYGEGFTENVYVGVPGFNEIGNVTYAGKPDYALSGWQRMLWFASEGQFGFAFTPPQEGIKMLYNRDVFQRVKSILIQGLRVDPDAYPVSDGSKLYFALQVYVNYPMHSGFSESNYLRFFAVVLVDVEQGYIQGYTVGEPDGFLVDLYRGYYPSWGKPPSWLVPQLRYAEALLGRHDLPGQLDVDFLFHVEEPFIWRSGSDFYERPTATEVLFILLTLGEEPYFIGLQLVEFQASPGKNLAGLYVAYGGDQLHVIELYRVANTSTTQLIGPTAAQQALETDDYVRTQLTLLTSRRLGNILLYSIGNSLYYFIPVYITTQVAEAVITKMAFIVAIDAATGTRVATGADAAEAYYRLTGAVPATRTGAEARLKKLHEAFTAKGYMPVNVTVVRANAEIEAANITYLDEAQWGQAELAVHTFTEAYARRFNASDLYAWDINENAVGFGILVSERGVVKLYYIRVQYR